MSATVRPPDHLAAAISTAEAARRVRVSERTVRRWAASGRVRAVQVGQSWWVSADDLPPPDATPNGHAATSAATNGHGWPPTDTGPVRRADSGHVRGADSGGHDAADTTADRAADTSALLVLTAAWLATASAEQWAAELRDCRQQVSDLSRQVGALEAQRDQLAAECARLATPAPCWWARWWQWLCWWRH